MNSGKRAIDDGRRRMLFAFTLGHRLQRDEHDAVVRRRAGEAEAVDRERAAHFLVLLEDLLHLVGDVRGVVERRAVGRLHDHHEVVLILVRHEAGRHRAIDPRGERQQADEHQRHRPLQREDDPQHRDVAAREPVDHVVDAAEEAALLAFRGRRINADIAGVNVSELNVDSAIENAIVSANC